MTDVLKLVLTDHWFEEIKSGRKTHEYRQAKPFWDKRIGWIKDAFDLKDIDAEVYSDVFIPNVIFQKAYRKNPETMEFTIKDVNDSMFNVIAFSSLTDSVITSGWIYKNNHLGIFSSAYNKEQHMQLFEHPSTNSEIVIEESSYNSDVYEVIDADGEWLKVRIRIRDSIFEGWMPPFFQCSNPYTTCS